MVSVVFQTHHYQNASHYILRLPTNLQYPFDNGTWIMLFVIIYSYEAALQSYTIFLNSGVPAFQHRHVHHSDIGISSWRISCAAAHQVCSI
jgi:sterol desaturase/sphingolipid hydroxylase (fatty acid hydroxylase superfamily)